MKFELKNVKYAAFASEETACYEANDWLKANETWDATAIFGENTHLGDKEPQDLEGKCAELLDAWLVQRDVKNALKRKVLFTQPNEKGIFQVAKRGNKVEDIKNALRQRHGYGLMFLNDLPLSDAIKVY